MPSSVIQSVMQPGNLQIHSLGSMHHFSVHSLHSAYSLFLCSLSWSAPRHFRALSLSNSRSSALPFYLSEVCLLNDTPSLSADGRQAAFVWCHSILQYSNLIRQCLPHPRSLPHPQRSRDQVIKTPDLLAPSDRDHLSALRSLGLASAQALQSVVRPTLNSLDARDHGSWFPICAIVRLWTIFGFWH